MLNFSLKMGTKSCEPTFYIITVHYSKKEWIEIQNKYIRSYTSLPHKVIAIVSEGLEDITPKDWTVVRDGGIKDHATKLNIAGDLITGLIKDDDIIVFLDSDCFPIANWCDHILNLLSQKQIIAVQRLENLGDIQPHPCFSCIKAHLWREIKGDWRMGYKWQTSSGHQVTDVGGNMMQILGERGIDWHPIHRTNTFNAHPLFFGIYGDIVYHHGAGSREKVDRVEASEAIGSKRIPLPRRFIEIMFRFLHKALGKLMRHIDQHIGKLIYKDTLAKVKRRRNNIETLSDDYINRIVSGEDISSIFRPHRMTLKDQQGIGK